MVHDFASTSGVGSVLSRLDNIAADSSGTSPYVRYTYLGVGTIVKEEHPGVSGGLTLNYNLDGSYGGWDRFGRIIEQDWQVNGSDVDHIDYTYDRNSNRTARTNQLASAYSESYGYDGLDRLTNADRNGVDLQSWNLDELGNWTSTTSDIGTQTRGHNAANELLGTSGTNWMGVVHDQAGNMSYCPKPGAETSTLLNLVYDGWNRLVQVRVGASVVGSYEYDAAGRRIEKTSGGDTLHYFWNENYQNIETRKNDSINPLEQWVFDIRYVDAPVVRFYDSNTDGTIDNTLYATFDANFNVTAIVNLSGSVVERYVYTPYGTRTVLDASFANPSSTSAYAQDRGHQGLVIDPETGLVYNRARYLHTSLGRFTIRDLIGYGDGMNLYSLYCAIQDTDPNGTSVQRYTNPDVGRMQASLKNWQQRLALLERQKAAAAAKGIPISDVLTKDIASKQAMVNQFQSLLQEEQDREAAWNRLDQTIETVTNDFNKRFYPGVQKKCAGFGVRTTTPLDASLLKAVLFKETQMGMDTSWQRGQELKPQYETWRQAWDAWAQNGKQGPEPAQPFPFYQLNLGRVTDAALYNRVNQEYGIGRALGDAFADDKTRDVQLAAGALLEKLCYACEQIKKGNGPAKGERDIWKYVVQLYNGSGRAAVAYANDVWELYKHGVNPYAKKDKLW